MKRLIGLLALVTLLVAPSRVLGFCFELAASYYGLDPALLHAIAHVESSMNHRALNRNADGSWDVGLMQVNSRWWGFLDRKRLVEDPCYNVLAGAWILKMCVLRYGYTWDAVVCYNTGRSFAELDRPRREKALKYVRKVWDHYQRVRIRLERSSRT